MGGFALEASLARGGWKLQISSGILEWALPLAGCVSLDQALNFSELLLPHPYSWSHNQETVCPAVCGWEPCVMLWG